MDLTAIPGVGEKTANALAALDDPERALRDGDVAALARAPGITEGRAAAIARAAIRHEHDDDGDFLATDRAAELYREALALLQERTVTDYAARRLETLFPTAAASRIEEVRTFTDRAIDRDPDPDAIAALEDVAPLTEPHDLQVRERCLATGDAERYAAAEETYPELPVEIAEDARDLADLARGYATVIALDAGFAGLDIENSSDADVDVQVRPDALEEVPVHEIVPERPLSFFADNREHILAAAAVHETADLEPPCSLDRLRDALDQLDEDGTVAGDDELDRLAAAVDDLDAAMSTAESVANDHLRTAIAERDVTIDGTDFLTLVEEGARVDSLLARELSEEHEAAVETAREHVVDALALEEHEADIAERCFGGEPTFPVERDETAVSRLRTELTTARDRRATRLRTDLAEELAALREPVEQLVRTALELDVEYAIARFAADFECSMPVFEGGPDESSDEMNDSSPGISIRGGRLPLLDVAFEDVEPVDYDVEGVRLLSGVNSGGKTSTLDLVAFVAILAHMGLPVPADSVRLQRFSEVHYHAKTQGTLDAGAFESTLRDFRAITDGAVDRLVLVDELESITEPGASAKIIAGILEALDRQGATAIFVSHLAREIRAAAAMPITVDGIEAQGLDDGELVVDRSPRRNHLARSTPELIVEKLAEDGDEFYEGLLEKF